jgi:hypothetical protein
MINVGEDMGEKEPLHTVGENVNGYNQYGSSMDIPQKELKTVLWYDPTFHSWSYT